MGKTVLVTGASRGIGACIAETFASRGYDIALNCVSEKDAAGPGADVRDRCRSKGVQAECFAADVSDFSACAEMVKQVCARFGGIDVLVNNAGITRDALLVRMSEAEFDAVLNVNLKGAFNMMRHVGRVMMRARGGHIVSLASVSGLRGNAGQANYAASKAGIVGLTKTAAKELGPRGVTVNAVAPGFIETPMTAVLTDKIRQAALANIPLGRLGRPQDVANAVCFLGSDEASYITGQVLPVDGGMIL